MMTAEPARGLCLGGLLLGGLVVWLGVACSPGSSDGRTGDEEPSGERSLVRNVVLVSIDTLRPDRLGLYGYERDTSPRLDGLAGGGLVWEQAVSPAPWTAPAHAALFSSLYPSLLGLGDWAEPGRVPERAVVLAEVLGGAGLRTCAITSGAFLDEAFGFGQGFELYNDEFKRMKQTVDRGLAWLDTLGGEERFFLFLHTYDVHGYAPPPASVKQLVRPYDGPLLRDVELSKTVQSPKRLLALERTTPADRRFLSDAYDAAIHSSDAQFGRLVDALGERGLLADTLIVFTSDHGEEFYERGGTGHGYTVYDENLRVPLAMLHPALEPGRVEELVRLIDVAPTIALLAGAERPPGWIGSSLVTSAGAPRSGGSRLAYSEFSHRPYVALRALDLKLIENTESGAFELYDLALDPAESRNLAGTGRAHEAELREQLANLRARLEPIYAAAGQAEIDPELARQLEALGYVGD